MINKIDGKPIIIRYTDIDDTVFDTSQFRSDMTDALSDDKAQEINREIDKYRKLLGTSALVPFVDMFGEEKESIDNKLDRKKYIYEDAQRYFSKKFIGAYAVVDALLTTGKETNQEFKRKNTILEQLPMVTINTKDKIDYICSMRNAIGQYQYRQPGSSEIITAEKCIMVDDKLDNFMSMDFNDFYDVENLSGFTGFHIDRYNKHSYDIAAGLPEVIHPIHTLDHVTLYISHMDMD